MHNGSEYEPHQAEYGTGFWLQNSHDARQWHQFYATVDLFQLREVQVFCLGVALVIGGLALLSGAAVHQAWKL